ncbi:MAG: phosphate ABC transporter ATP-binding protein, partial [Pirellulaceae bacterium]
MSDAATTPTQTEYSIETLDLNLWYGDFQAIKKITVRIKTGLVTGLIGPSGCGKTTLLRCFNRINERYGNVTTTGRITVLGKNIYDENVSLSELRKTVGMVFQRPNPLPISIYNNVLFGVQIHTRRRDVSRATRNEMVERALREVDLWDAVKDKLSTKATRLTLEQQQKLCIARLLPLRPRVILMDEPCSALDAEGTEKIEALLETFRERYTVVIVTHNMAQA